MKPRILLLLILTGLLIAVCPGKVMAQQTEEQLGVQYYNNKELDKALATFEVLFSKNPSQFNYLYYTNTLFELKEFDKAEKIIRKQLKANPQDPRYQVDLGYLYIMQGDITKGRKIYENCLKDLQSDKMQIYNLSYAFSNRRETDYVIRTYLRGRAELNDPAAFAFELAYTYEALGITEQMIDEYLNLLISNPQQITLVQNRLQAWLSDDVDNTKNDTYRKVLLKKSQQNPDEILYNELLLWHSIQQKDFPFAILQAKALDRRYGENGQRIFDLAALCVSNENYDAAIDGYNYIIQKKANKDMVMRSRIELINTQFVQYKKSYSQDKDRLLLMKQEYIQLLDELGKTSFTIPLFLNLAHLQAFYLGETEAAIALLLQAISIPNVLLTSQAGCKLELADIYLFSSEQWEATLLYSQVEKTFKNEPLGHEAKFRNAKLSFYIGEFGWALAQLDVLKAATSKLIANDALELSLLISDNIEEDSVTVPLSMYAEADLIEFRNHDSDALAVLDSISVLYPRHSIADNVLFKKAEIYSKNGKFDLAAVNYSDIIEKYSYDLLADDALYNLAGLYENQLNNKGKAMELYEKILTQFPGSLYVVDARKHFRALRNDAVN
ncbi:MAG: tetratricopeptide repeat protein [Bacteroidales bacterium]|nr:tetratricopeptide repeat protein [Bacteroidales bacterium]